MVFGITTTNISDGTRYVFKWTVAMIGVHR